MELINARIVLAQGAPIQVQNTFQAIIAEAILEEENAMAIVLELEPELILYCQYYALQQMYRGITRKEDFIDAWRCDGLYRNRTALKTEQGDEIDPGSLWLLKGDRLLLMDEDNFIECPFNTQAQLFDRIV